MGAIFRSWWQYLGKHKVAAIITVFVLVVVIVFIFASNLFAGYWFGWTGFNGDTIKWQPTITNGTPLPIKLEEQQPAKTLWDWLQLLGVLAVPVVVGFGAVWFTTRQGKVADAENTDNQRETALQAYIDKMSELLLHEKLRDSTEEDEVRKVARVGTLTILPRLDAKRKYHVLQFLYEAGLINKPAISLNGADLSGADLSGTDLCEALMCGANLSGAVLVGADLRGANLNGAIVTTLQLEQAKSLQEAIMPDGSKHP